MANINFNEINSFNQNNSRNNEIPGFFALSGDGDEAIVRFMHDSTDSFDIVSVHSVNLNGKFRNVNCIRDPKEPLERCPLCARGDRINNRIYIHLIEYVIDPATGQVSAKPRVWDRSLVYAQTLKNYLDNYGPLSDMICKIIRHGARGSMQTTYEIVPNLSKQVYPDNVYIKPTDAFANYKAVGYAVLDKSYDELQTYVQTGNFPEPQPRTNKTVNTINNIQPVDPTGYQQINVTPLTVNQPAYPPITPNYNPMGNDFTPPQTPTVVTATNNTFPTPAAVTPVVQKPVRYY